MKNAAIILVTAIVVIVLIFAYLNRNQLDSPTTAPTPTVTSLPEQTPLTTQIPTTVTTPVATVSSSPINATYTIEGSQVTLVNGEASTPIPNSSATIDTMVWGQPTYGALTPTTTKDAGVVLVQTRGGSGTFYYVAASLQVTGGYKGTNAIFIGDRISPQTMQIVDQTIIFNYAEPAEGDSNPSMAASKYFKVQGTQLVEVPPPTN